MNILKNISDLFSRNIYFFKSRNICQDKRVNFMLSILLTLDNIFKKKILTPHAIKTHI